MFLFNFKKQIFGFDWPNFDFGFSNSIFSASFNLGEENVVLTGLSVLTKTILLTSYDCFWTNYWIVCGFLSCLWFFYYWIVCWFFVGILCSCWACKFSDVQLGMNSSYFFRQYFEMKISAEADFNPVFICGIKAALLWKV